MNTIKPQMENDTNYIYTTRISGTVVDNNIGIPIGNPFSYLLTPLKSNQKSMEIEYKENGMEIVIHLEHSFIRIRDILTKLEIIEL